MGILHFIPLVPSLSSSMSGIHLRKWKSLFSAIFSCELFELNPYLNLSSFYFNFIQFTSVNQHIPPFYKNDEAKLGTFQLSALNTYSSEEVLIGILIIN